jgi:hypothetical protein
MGLPVESGEHHPETRDEVESAVDLDRNFFLLLKKAWVQGKEFAEPLLEEIPSCISIAVGLE